MHQESIACSQNNICEAQTQFSLAGGYATLLLPMLVKIFLKRVCINIVIK